MGPRTTRGGGWTDEGRRVDRRREKGRDENVLCNFENQRCENLTSTDTTPLCLRAQPAEFLHSHLSVRISTDRKTLGDRTSCWLLSALIFNSLLSLAGLMVFSSKLCTSVLLYFFLHSRLLYSPYPPSLPETIIS